MKNLRLGFAALGWILAALNASADNYTITIPPGFSLVANRPKKISRN